MGNLLSYSGIATKLRAMKSKFISERQFQDMASLSSVGEALEFLKNTAAYGQIFSGIDAELHRSDIEKLLSRSQHQDFEKLYHFANLSQRKFLNLYFTNFEISILKKCLRNTLEDNPANLDLSMFQEFFRLHSKLDLEKLSSASTFSQLTMALEGTPYHGVFKELEQNEPASLFDYEMQLDLFHFRMIWKQKNKSFTREEQKTITQCFGSQMDMLNLQWIYRSKKYYHMEPATIYSLLIPVRYKLKQEDIRQLVESGSIEEFFNLLSFTYYGKMRTEEISERPNLELLYEKVLSRIYSVTSQKNPYSIAILNSYFYFKNVEIHRIITTIEGIRYGVNTSDIISYSMKN